MRSSTPTTPKIQTTTTTTTNSFADGGQSSSQSLPPFPLSSDETLVHTNGQQPLYSNNGENQEDNVQLLAENTKIFHMGTAQGLNSDADRTLQQAFKDLVNQLKADADKSKNKYKTAQALAAQAVDLQNQLALSQDDMPSANYVKQQREAIQLFEKQFRATSGWQTFGKVLGAICFAVVGLIAGIVAGAAIGYALSAWTGPGGFVGAAAGAFLGGTVGVAMGVTFALGGLGGVAAGITSGHFLFKPSPAVRDAEKVALAARQKINQIPLPLYVPVP